MPAEPPDLTPAELDAFSTVSASEKEQAAAAWRADAPNVAKNLLDATEDDAAS